MTAKTNCAICGKSDARFLWKGVDYFYQLPGEFDLRKCLACGLIFIDPPPPEDVLSKYYPKDYYSYETGGLDASQAPTSKTAYYFRHPLKALNALFYSKILRQNVNLDVSPGSSVLDIGCGDGRYLRGQKNEGCRVFGVDLSSEALARLKNHLPDANVYCGHVWDAGFAEASFDLIRLDNVMEHITDIAKLTAELRRLVHPNGRILIRVPNSDSLTFLLFARRWIHLDTPRHVYVFSKKNLRKFLDGYGFSIESHRTLENSFSVLGSLIYLYNSIFLQHLRIDKTRFFWDSELLKILLFPYTFFTNFFQKGDVVEFILKKES